MYTLIMIVGWSYNSGAITNVVVPNLSYQECVAAGKKVYTQFQKGPGSVYSSVCAKQGAS